MQVENCSKFWFQPKSERKLVEHFDQELNQKFSKIIEPCTDYTALIQAQIIVARDENTQKLHRARLISWDYNDSIRNFKGTVCFIDSGRKQECHMNDLYIFTGQTEQITMPPRCFQCKLAEIQPSMANISGGNMWDRKAIETFNSFVLDRELKATVSETS